MSGVLFSAYLSSPLVSVSHISEPSIATHQLVATRHPIPFEAHGIPRENLAYFLSLRC